MQCQRHPGRDRAAHATALDGERDPKSVAPPPRPAPRPHPLLDHTQYLMHPETISGPLLPARARAFPPAATRRARDPARWARHAPTLLAVISFEPLVLGV